MNSAVMPDDNTIRITLVETVDNSYSLFFGMNLFPKIASDLKETPIGVRYAIITDSNVGPLYAGKLEECFRTEGLDADTVYLQAGEKKERLDTCEEVGVQMSQKQYGRDCAILALGGGVVGDTAGLVAASFNRGVPYVQIPTTVLAQADSSVGGKTAVDTRYGKNLWGAFKQPRMVYIDVATLETLPYREYRAGLAETIKHGIIADSEFFEYLERNMGDILRRSPELSLHIAKQNCMIKGRVVAEDPDERGKRRILNYGHTVGHAVEKLSGFELLHGEAVSVGMMSAGRIAREYGFSDLDLQRQERLLRSARLPTTIPSHVFDEAITSAVSIDKKASKGRPRFSLPAEVGIMHEFGGAYATYVDDNVFAAALRESR